MVRGLARQGLLCCALIVLILAVYWPVLHLGFITYDDPDYVTSNASVRAGLTWNSVKWAFTHTSSAEWHPLTMISHMVDCQIYNLNAWGHHLTNLMLHAANSLILCLFLLELTQAFCPASWWHFFSHFIPSMSKRSLGSWISERKGLLSTFFGLSSLFAYVRYAKACISTSGTSRSLEAACAVECGSVAAAGSSVKGQVGTPLGHQRLFYGMALVLLALGLLSKPMLVTWPFLMLLLDFWPLRRADARDFRRDAQKFARLLLEKIPFFALVLASSIATFFVAQSWGAVTPGAQTPISVRLSNSVLAYVLYIAKLIWPVNLSIDYPFHSDLAPTKLLWAAGLLTLITILILKQWKQKPFLLVGWAWFIGTLAPVIGLLHFGNHFMADRYSYVTAIGLFIMLAWTVASLAVDRTKQVLLGYLRGGGCCDLRSRRSTPVGLLAK